MISGFGCDEGAYFGLYVGRALHEVGKDCVPVMGEDGIDGTVCVCVECGL